MFLIRVGTLALVSSVPMRPATLQVSEAQGRYAAAVIDMQAGPEETEPIMVVGLYLQCGDEATAAGQAEDILQQPLRVGFGFVAIGDFNMLPQHPVLVECLAAGGVCAGDDCRPGEELPPIGPIFQGHRRRRIDFSLQHAQLRAQEVSHHEGPSDHVVVSYSSDLTAPRLRRIREDVSPNPLWNLPDW